MKTKKNTIQLKLYTKYFKDVDYGDNNDCVVARAIKEQIKGFKPNVGVTCAWDENRTGHSLYFKDYKDWHFKRDSNLAKKSVHNKIIRTIVATKSW